jgi:hypothetical protein
MRSLVQREQAKATELAARTVTYLQWRVEQILAAEHGAGAVKMPSRATFYRLFDQVKLKPHSDTST